MTLLEDEIKDLRNVQDRIHRLREAVHKYLSLPESDIEFDRLSAVLLHISTAIDLMTGKTKVHEVPIKMELLTSIKMESGFIREKCFFQCPICKRIKVYDMYNYKSEIPDPNICEECNKGLDNIEETEKSEV